MNDRGVQHTHAHARRKKKKILELLTFLLQQDATSNFKTNHIHNLRTFLFQHENKTKRKKQKQKNEGQFSCNTDHRGNKLVYVFIYMKRVF